MILLLIVNEHQHDDSASGRIRDSIGKPAEEEQQQQHHNRFKKNNNANKDENKNHNGIRNSDNNNSSMQETLTMFCAMCAGTQRLSQHACKDETSTFHALPSSHCCTGHMQNQTGKAYFEM